MSLYQTAKVGCEGVAECMRCNLFVDTALHGSNGYGTIHASFEIYKLNLCPSEKMNLFGACTFCNMLLEPAGIFQIR